MRPTPLFVAVMALAFIPQDRVLDSGVLRFYQGGTEVGRETFRRTTRRLTTETVVPKLDTRLRYQIDFTSDGGFAAMEAIAYSLSGDSLIRRYTARADADSLRLMQAEAAGSERTWSAAGRPDAAIGTQSMAGVADLIARANRRDTTFSVWSPEQNATTDMSVTFSADTARVRAGPMLVLAPVDAAGRAISLSIPAGGVSAVRAGAETLEPLAGITRPAPDYSAGPDDPYIAEEVRVPVTPATSDPFELAGTLSLPIQGEPPYPAVVMITGSGSQDRDESLWPLVPAYRPFRQIAARLAAAGIAVLRLDDRATGASGGNAASATTPMLADDVRAELAWLRTRPEIDGDRLALVGHSEGGVIAPMVAADDPRLAAIVIMAGTSKPGSDVLRDQVLWPLSKAEGLTEGEREQVRTASLEATAASMPDLNPWMRWFWDYDPLPTARRVTQPALILQGAWDRQVSAGQADTLAAAMRDAGNHDVELHVFPRLNHLFLVSLQDGSASEYAAIERVVIPDEVMDILANWLTRRLRPEGEM